ncbi:MAG: hypothetical protein J6W96_01765, partial [Alphaproteobacteria bacterium]|nr:hypothetical protein [Alphaproteobacteria bacterium]
KKKLSEELAAQNEFAMREYKLSMDDINLATAIWNEAAEVMNDYRSSGEMVRVVATTSERQPAQQSASINTSASSYTMRDKYSRD